MSGVLLNLLSLHLTIKCDTANTGLEHFFNYIFKNFLSYNHLKTKVVESAFLDYIILTLFINLNR